MTASTVSAHEAPPLPHEARGASARSAGEAAEDVVARHSVQLDVFGVHIQLPPPDQLAFLGGVGVLAALEIIEWPVALVLGVGHQLAHSRHGRMLREFGEALEEA
ncbi:hypothetical protein [Streptomyces sp. NPDC093568]|uniref:hypothetical protein n=1 Tax=Streptomyces sp. NPDC093568 TaxID=3366041 RepID=UPI003817A88A